MDSAATDVLLPWVAQQRAMCVSIGGDGIIGGDRGESLRSASRIERGRRVSSLGN